MERIEDLNKSHYKIWEKNPEISQSKEHTKLSIQFAIEVLKKIFTDGCGNYDDVCSKDDFIREYINKSYELKQYYDSQI